MTRKDRFNSETLNVERVIRQRIRYYEYAIDGVGAFVGSCADLSADGFAEYVKSVKLAERYTGLTSVVYAEENKQTGEVTVKFMEPSTADKKLIGTDANMIGEVRSVISQMNNTDGLIVSNIFDTPNNRGKGILISERVNVFGKNGYVGVIFRPDSFFETIVSRDMPLNDGWRMRVYDKSDLIFKNGKISDGQKSLPILTNGIFVNNIDLNINKEKWNIVFDSRDELGLDDLSWLIPLIITIGGIVASFLIFWRLRIIINDGLRNINLSNGFTSGLWREHKLFETLFREGPTPVYIVDQNFRIVAINKKAADIYGYTESELLNKSIFDFIDEKKQGAWTVKRKRFFSGEIKELPAQEIIRQQFLNGKKIIVEVKRYPIFDRDGKVIYCMVFLKDLSKKNKN